ncbi:MAG: hypothetical protein ACFE7R_04515, partial [Candidatus Hodarchaeota archaeon]
MLDDLDRLMEKSQIDALMAIGNAFETPDIYWLTGFRSGDVITYVKNVGEEAVVASFFNTLERVQKESNIKQTYDLSDTMIGMLKEGRNPRKHLDVFDKEVTQEVVNGKIIGVPNHYPAHRLVILQKLGYEVKVVSDLLQEARAKKSAAEVKAIVRAGKATTGAISSVLEMVKDSDIGTNKVLIHKGKPLTVGTMKLALEHHLLDNNAESAEDSILAVGKKAFDWHYLGRPTDKMKADTPVILDVFPRLKH